MDIRKNVFLKIILIVLLNINVADKILCAKQNYYQQNYYQRYGGNGYKNNIYFQHDDPTVINSDNNVVAINAINGDSINTNNNNEGIDANLLEVIQQIVEENDTQPQVTVTSKPIESQLSVQQPLPTTSSISSSSSSSSSNANQQLQNINGNIRQGVNFALVMAQQAGLRSLIEQIVQRNIAAIVNTNQNNIPINTQNINHNVINGQEILTNSNVIEKEQPTVTEVITVTNTNNNNNNNNFNNEQIDNSPPLTVCDLCTQYRSICQHTQPNNAIESNLIAQNQASVTLPPIQSATVSQTVALQTSDPVTQNIIENLESIQQSITNNVMPTDQTPNNLANNVESTQIVDNNLVVDNLIKQLITNSKFIQMVKENIQFANLKQQPEQLQQPQAVQQQIDVVDDNFIDGTTTEATVNNVIVKDITTESVVSELELSDMSITDVTTTENIVPEELDITNNIENYSILQPIDTSINDDNNNNNNNNNNNVVENLEKCNIFPHHYYHLNLLNMEMFKKLHQQQQQQQQEDEAVQQQIKSMSDITIENNAELKNNDDKLNAIGTNSFENLANKLHYDHYDYIDNGKTLVFKSDGGTFYKLPTNNIKPIIIEHQKPGTIEVRPIFVKIENQ